MRIILHKGDIVTLKPGAYQIAIKDYKFYLEHYLEDKLNGKEVIIKDLLYQSSSYTAMYKHIRVPVMLPIMIVSPIYFSDLLIGLPLMTIDKRKPLLRGQCKISLIKSQVSIQS